MFLTSTETASLNKALALAQGELQDAAKSSFNPGFKSKYADLAEVLKTVRPVLSKHGLAVIQGLSTSTEGSVQITTRLTHESGQYIEDMLTVPVPKKDAQGIGNASTYGRRYGLAAIVGISQDDDDGNSVTVAKAKPVQRDTVPLTVATLTAEFAKATAKTMPNLKLQYAGLTAAEQTQVLPAAKAAADRIAKLGSAGSGQSAVG